jgi:quercetin dioxygenase-like cupin family protein
MADLWGTEQVPAPLDAPFQSSSHLLPPKGGSIFRFFEIPPAPQGSDAAALRREAAAQFQAAVAAQCQVDTTRHPMMHRTLTVDYVVLLRGEVTLLLDEGEFPLKPFDAVVQRGTNHYWVNGSDSPALLLGVLLDAC